MDTPEDQLIKLKYEIYQRKLRTITEEELFFEYTQRIGDELRELEQKPLGTIINDLEQWCAFILGNDPGYMCFDVKDILFKGEE